MSTFVLSGNKHSHEPACPNVQTGKSLRCSDTQSMDVDDDSDHNLDI